MSRILERTEEFVQRIFAEKIDTRYTYHNLQHTRDVVGYVREIAAGSGLTEQESLPLVLAAWFHDTGFTVSYENHEAESARIAVDFLTAEGSTPELVSQVEAAILATQSGSEPVTIGEKILKDADKFHTGKKGYKKRLAALREEWKLVLGKTYPDAEWYRMNLEYLNGVQYHTPYVQQQAHERRQRNIENLLELAGAPPGNAQYEPLKGEDKRKTPDRGIETVFRTTSKNHLDLSAMADNKANLMISVNAIIISITLSTLFSQLELHQHLVIPTVILIAVCLATMIFAILATRPKITKGYLTREDIDKKRGNLLFFGNFYRMPLQDYEYGMRELMKDGEYLYGSMIRDVYYLGLVLEKKYRYLRISYDIFVFGLVIVVAAFLIALAF